MKPFFFHMVWERRQKLSPGKSCVWILVVLAFWATDFHAHAKTVLLLPTSSKPQDQLATTDPVEYEEFLQKIKDKPPKGMVLIPSGRFMMGSARGNKDEKPGHEVALGPFYMDIFEVTQKEFEEVMGFNPSIFTSGTFTGGYLKEGESSKDYAKYMGDNRPVERVSWHDAKDYCQNVGKRLPTEAEWEYAARAGSTTKYYWGDKMDVAYAWSAKNARSRSHLVGQKEPNAFGLYDMAGNIMEWVADWYDKSYYSTSPTTNPKGPATGNRKVLRGGSWYAHPNYSRSAYRVRNDPTLKYTDIGFRLCVGSSLG